MSAVAVQRDLFTTSRTLEFFSEKELQMQIGFERDLWPLALVKELVDNALDACESIGVAPEITVTVGDDRVTVQDNGPGIPDATIVRSLDYLVRASDKSHYVSPTRGQMGNALKTVYAAPFVATGNHGRVDILTNGIAHQVDVTLDRIEQTPRMLLRTSTDTVVKTGTCITLHWRGIASYLDDPAGLFFYNVQGIHDLLAQYATFNPHATFHLRFLDNPSHTWAGTATSWEKWGPSTPTSPHWYTLEKLETLIAGMIANERQGGRGLTIRELVAQFAGLSGSAKQKRVAEMAGVSGAVLSDLVHGDSLDRHKVEAVLRAMQAESRPVKASALGIIGAEHMQQRMYRCTPESVRYKKIARDDPALPFVVEVAFGVYQQAFDGSMYSLWTGMNWTPALRTPTRAIQDVLHEQFIDDTDSVLIAVHIACPRFDFVDRGKSTMSTPPEEMVQAIRKAVVATTKAWKSQKKHIQRGEQMRARELEEMRKAKKRETLSIKEAAYAVMEEAYMKASAHNTLPANARQVMYAARPLVMALTDNGCWKNSAYFTQHLLPDFIEESPDLTGDWDVVYDNRGKLIEPHTRDQVDLGTLSVRRYVGQWGIMLDGPMGVTVANSRIDTCGPVNRYQYVLFVEKEGFNELLKGSGLLEQYDLAVMSTKGMSTTAARRLVEQLSEEGVTILILHDFDKAGMSIAHTLQSDTRRYTFKHPPQVLDIGLRLVDAEQMGLENEHVVYGDSLDPRINLRESGATEAECAYLVRGRSGSGWYGYRIELNAMTSPQFLAYLERKFEEVGVEKVVPEAPILAKSYGQMYRLELLQQEIDRVIAALPDDDAIAVPPDLSRRVRDYFDGAPGVAWDYALRKILTEEIGSGEG